MKLKIVGGGRELDMDGILDGTIPGSYTLLQCRTVRIGSYKVVPKDRVLLSSVGIRIAVPAIEDGEYVRIVFCVVYNFFESIFLKCSNLVSKSE
jgi:hypothetical protein